MAWKAGHVFILHPVNGSLALIPIFYGERIAAIRITSNKDHWDGIIDPAGSVYVVAPGLRSWAGPVTLPAYLASKLTPAEKRGAVAELMTRVNALPEPPPFDAPAFGYPAS